jgi:hypothetical protein
MSPAKRHPLYPQAVTNRKMLKTHEYCLIFRKPGDFKNENTKLLNTFNKCNLNKWF